MSDTHLVPHAIPFAFPALAGVRCLFSTALAGTMALGDDEAAMRAGAANRAALMRSAGFERWAGVYQVHGDTLVRADGVVSPDRKSTVQADGMFTVERGVGLAVMTADCQPILLARADGKAAAALHVGWRGNAMNFPGSAVARLCREFACLPSDLLAVRGPSLGPASAEFVNFEQEWPSAFRPWFDPVRRTVDLWSLTRRQLEQAGLPRGNIFSLDLCTKTMAGVFYSYRRKESGRQINIIWLEK